MNLNAFAAGARRRIFEDLEAGRPPNEGEFSQDLLKEAKARGKPQMGTTRYLPDSVSFEFIYPGGGGAAILFTVAVAPPERIVFLPVPEWVIEQIWQGEITGSFHFLSDADRMLDKFRQQLSVEDNLRLFS